LQSGRLTRDRTLQELIAPHVVNFYGRSWSLLFAARIRVILCQDTRAYQAHCLGVGGKVLQFFCHDTALLNGFHGQPSEW